MLLEHLKFKNRYTLETLVSNLDTVPALFLGVFLQAGCKFKWYRPSHPVKTLISNEWGIITWKVEYNLPMGQIGL